MEECEEDDIDAAIAAAKAESPRDDVVVTARPAAPTVTTVSGPPVKSPYRFVPLNDKVVTSPAVAAGIRLDLPHAEGVCGEIEVRWTAETAFLVGGAGEADKPARHVTMGGVPVLPGATIKGALRAVLAAASYSRLGRFNGHLRFGWREFKDPYYESVLLSERPVQAGWLRRSDDGGYEIDERAWFKIPLADLARKCGVGADAWRSTLAFDAKMRHLNRAKLLNNQARFSPSSGHEATLVETGGQSGTVVVSFKTPKAQDEQFAKKWEYVLSAVSQGIVPISAETVLLFDQLNSSPSGKRPKPNGAWEYWRKPLMDGKPIPVFFVEDKAVPVGHPGRYLLGLTRLFRIPQKNTPAEALPLSHGKQGNESPDFIEALFGHVDEPDAGAERDTALALRGRVAVGIARCDQPQQALEDKPIKRVMMTPQPSFYPFYLSGGQRGYMDDHPHLAGCKRYPVGLPPNLRDEGRSSPGGTDAVTSELEVIKSQTRDGAEVSFTGTIRFHNLLPAELGGLLWAITFGQPNGPYRHSIGRGKAFGLGQMRAEIVQLSAEPNRDEVALTVDQYLACFVAFMDEATAGAWQKGEIIRSLLSMADPDRGRANAAVLDYPGDFKAYKDLKTRRARLPPYR